ncbi:superoxide dismutase family protein [Polaribacter pectinis]|uniref:Superoxide dismutase family protein n=1 Tax=Polaribacter pectinis TaxID=2738844 RepID=A0A7G9LEE8_9FLAO|nr:superoxide dismutase family protein [Polaribacter pectinis]QNM86997.1 superoxide dismutase family protein [Polaribacter pectinis]
MKILKNLILSLITLILFSCGKGEEKTAIVNIEARSNSNVTGNVTFKENNGKLVMKAEVFGLSEGNHAIHIHTIGDCSAPDGKSAGGHWNPTNENHGKWMQEPFHVGDIGNIVADKDGKGTIERETDLWCINCEDETKNIVGKAIIVHAGPDDFSSQPSGAAGPRVGCGEIKVR